MPDNDNILVVGTTADYVEWIERRGKTNGIFLTARRERERAAGKYTAPKREILADLSHTDQCLHLLQDYLRSTRRSLAGIVCFDDESLPLAAALAKTLKMDFPSVESILQCLDKHTTKRVWQDCGVPCPKAQAVSCHATEHDLEALTFPCVLKPHSGSGSEFVFLCHTPQQAHDALQKISTSAKHAMTNVTAVVEEFIAGREFSCDFTISNGNIRILRTAQKCMAPRAPLGTAMAYILPSQLSPTVFDDILPDVLARATEALGISRALCMVDFIVTDDEDVFLLEISPRMGGDCLPHILLEAWGVDTLSNAMEFARGGTLTPWLKESAPTVVGLRVFSSRAGKVKSIDTLKIDSDPRLIAHSLRNRRGHTVVLPPEDYGSWLLGHVIFQPYAAENIEDQIHDLRDSIRIHIEEASA